MLPLLLPLAFAAGGVPHTTSQLERTYHVLETLTPAEARRLEGKRARFRVTLDSTGDDSFDVLAPLGLHATVYLAPDQEPADEMTVVARLVIIDHPASWGFAALREYRLVEAVRVWP
jgi:hypothetical protein